jgi:hypothetical protein
MRRHYAVSSGYYGIPILVRHYAVVYMVCVGRVTMQSLFPSLPFILLLDTTLFTELYHVPYFGFITHV